MTRERMLPWAEQPARGYVDAQRDAAAALGGAADGGR